MSRSDLRHLSGYGAVGDLERRLMQHFGMRHALAMPSATTALLALGLTLDMRGARFVAPPLTWGGSLGPWMMLGATPVFADVDRDSLTLDPRLPGLNRALPVRAILASDLFGVPCDDAALRISADALGAKLIVDGAQSLGATREGRPSGVHADAVVLSFSAGKILDAGEGGAVVTDDPELYEGLVWHSQHPHRQKRELGLSRVNEFAINGRMAPAVAERVLEMWDVSLQRVHARRACVTRYLAEADGLCMPDLGPVRPTWYHVTPRVVGSHKVMALPFPISVLPRSARFTSQGVPAEGRWVVAAEEAVRRVRVVTDAHSEAAFERVGRTPDSHQPPTYRERPGSLR